ncbi:type 1 glutamine amidotransferase domain-containing protein [Pseudoduganella sp. DS3]|uniref:Type 1 glutamine amidotransferase domain-containing protein n=1 Tax=Pseudoduganella guangdongensis TaxID=2692179 RepID=A0A6N9HDE3_9BURK|nr:type 1 glutamine amidotransferase domain-containing protein [Pseudoduganella guangdongensis]MYN00885.1 type 1 glutamine amidotransferase domain-containing protein [Pseudoduganella guangdongensis]
MIKKLTAIALAAAAFAATSANAGNVLVVLSDEATLDLKAGKTFQTGFYLNELMQPVKMLMDAGHSITFATPQGKAPTLDKGSVNPMFFGGDQAALDAHVKLLEHLRLTDKDSSPVVSLARVEQQGYAKYDAVYVPGGHAPMQDLLASPALGKVLTAFHKDGKPTALVCHGPIALLSAMPDAKGFTMKLAQGAAPAQPKWIYSGYKVTVFSNAEEEASKAQLGGGEMKFYPETALVKAGLKFSKAANWEGNIVTDRELITGQNPASAPLVGKELLVRLQK